MAHRAGGRRIRFLGNVSDARLCRLYQKAGWSIYPSRYEGFGFPILDSLRHGTPVLSSCTSSMGEFDHPGVFFFDPQDPATVDLAWQRLQATKPVTIPRARLDDLYNWDLVARALLDAHARNGEGVAAGRSRSRGPGISGASAGQAGGAPPSLPLSRGRSRRLPLASSRALECGSGSKCSGPRPLAATGRSGGTAGTSSPRCWPATRPTITCSMVQDGLPTDQIPTAPNAVVRLLRPDPARGETTLAHAMERLTATNPDGLDVLLLLNPLEMVPDYDLPAKPLNGLKMVAVVHDLIPLLFQEEYFSCWPGPEYVGRYFQGLNRLRSYDVLLANSEATRRDFLSLLGLSPDRVVTIGTASDGRFFVPDRTDPMPAESRRCCRYWGSRGRSSTPWTPWSTGKTCGG